MKKEEISIKSTKQQILDAYQSTLKDLKSMKTRSPQEEKKDLKEAETLKKTEDYSLEGIVTGLSGLKIELTKQLDQLGEKLVYEFRKLTELKNAIEVEQSHLEEIYGIKEEADSLAALLKSHEEEKQKFTEEMGSKRHQYEGEISQMRETWSEQKTTFKREEEEYLAHREKTRKREEEDYQYQLEKKRREDQDAYEQGREKIKKEDEDKRQELLLLEKNLKEQEDEFKKLKQQVEEAPEVQKKEIEEAIETASAELTKQYEYEKNLAEKISTGQKQLYEQKIKALEEKLKEQTNLIEHMKKKTDMAMEQVEKIANRALDTSVQRNYIKYTDETKYSETKGDGK